MAGVWLADRIGRRWTHFALLALSSVLFFIIMWLVYDPALSPAVTTCCMIIKTCVSATLVVSYIQVQSLFKDSQSNAKLKCSLFNVRVIKQLVEFSRTARVGALKIYQIKSNKIAPKLF